MLYLRSIGLRSVTALSLLALATFGGDRAAAVTKLHDPAFDHTTVVYGATNGNGINRGPWVVQIAAAKDEYLEMTTDTQSGAGGVRMRAIAGDGSVYFSYTDTFPYNEILCLKVPVSGWVTVHVDVNIYNGDGPSEERLFFRYQRRGIGQCEIVSAPH